MFGITANAKVFISGPWAHSSLCDLVQPWTVTVTDIYLHENLQDYYFEVLKLALYIIYNPQYTENYYSQWLTFTELLL